MEVLIGLASGASKIIALAAIWFMMSIFSQSCAASFLPSFDAFKLLALSESIVELLIKFLFYVLQRMYRISRDFNWGFLTIVALVLLSGQRIELPAKTEDNNLLRSDCVSVYLL